MSEYILGLGEGLAISFVICGICLLNEIWHAHKWKKERAAREEHLARIAHYTGKRPRPGSGVYL